MVNLKVGDTVIVIDNKQTITDERIMLNYANKQDCLKWSYGKRPNNGFRANITTIIDGIAIISDDKCSYAVSLEGLGLIVQKPKFVTIKQFYDYAVRHGVENCAFGISITGSMTDDASDIDGIELLEKFSLDNIDINGKYYAPNETVKDNFVWVYLKLSE